jgi:hypothetical protein
MATIKNTYTYTVFPQVRFPNGEVDGLNIMPYATVKVPDGTVILPQSRQEYPQLQVKNDQPAPNPAVTTE